jgi:probable F420-dependent oxidoreductase
VKVRIGFSGGTAGLDGAAVAALADDLEELGFDSLWLPEVLSAPGVDPMVGLAWAGSHNAKLKLGTTALMPGRNLVRLAKQLASLDVLSGGRLLVTLVPGIPRGAERSAVGVDPKLRGRLIDDGLPVLRALWRGERVSHDGPAGRLEDVSITPVPVQDPLEVWLGGTAPAALERCGRLSDGWLPALCTPKEVAAGRLVVEAAAQAAGRQISPEHFGVSVAYSHQPLDERVSAQLASRAKGRPLEDLIPVGWAGLRARLEEFLEVGFSKFVVRPLVPSGTWRAELEGLATAVGDLQN